MYACTHACYMSRLHFVSPCWCECYPARYFESVAHNKHEHLLSTRVSDCPSPAARAINKQCRHSFTNHPPKVPPSHHPEADPPASLRWLQLPPRAPILVDPAGQPPSTLSLVMTILNCRQYEKEVSMDDLSKQIATAYSCCQKSMH